MKPLFLILPMVLAWGSANHKFPQYHYDFENVLYEHVKDAEATYHLTPYLKGGGYLNKIRSVNIELISNDIPTGIEEARRLVVTLSEDVLRRVNEAEELRPHLITYPFPSEKIRYRIFFFKKDGEFARNPGDSKDPNNLYWVFNENGTIVYSIRNETSEGIIDVHKEPYSEALKIVQQTQ